jgi:Replication-relaxation
MSARYVTKAMLRELSAQLTAHDYAVIQRVSVLRFASGAQLTRMYFVDSAADPRAARRALLRLVRLCCLERLPRSVGGARAGSAGFIYRLGPAGQRLAIECGWQPDGHRRQSHVPGTLFLGHALQVAELHTLLVEADRAGRIELLGLESEPACWRRYGQRTTLKPDSYARLGIGDYEDSYFIEVDMGTESSRTLERKLGDYLAYQASGREQAECGVFPKVLWLTPDTERAGIIEDCIKWLPHSAQRLFAVAPFVDVLNVVTDTATLTDTQLNASQAGVQ